MLIDIWNLPYLGAAPYEAYPSKRALGNEDRICRILCDHGVTWMIASGMSDGELLGLSGMGRKLVRHFREIARWRDCNLVFRPMCHGQKMESANSGGGE